MFPGLMILFVFGQVLPSKPLENPTAKDFQDLLSSHSLTWKVPGAGMVIVYPGVKESVFVSGVRSLGGTETINSETLFPAGSLTKAFTTSLVALATARGKCSWDDTVHKYLDWIPESLTLENPIPLKLWHLGSHTTGMGSHDLLAVRQNEPNRAGVEKLLTERPLWAAGSHFQYQNLMVRALGMAMEKRNGYSWSSQVRKDLLLPLGIRGETFDRDEFQSRGNRASPHRLGREDHPEQWVDAWFSKYQDPCASLSLPLKAWDPWIRLHLGLPTPLPEAEIKAILETHLKRIRQPETIQDREYQPEMDGLGYGLGWVTLKYRGETAIAHGGVMEGYRAFILLLPERKAGVVVFANLDRSPMCHAVACQALDLLLGAQRVDWNERLNQKKKREADEKKQLENAVETASQAWIGTIWPKEWAGTYQNQAYGEIRFQNDGGRAILVFRGQKYPVKRVGVDRGFLFDPFLGDCELNFQSAFLGLRVRIGGRIGAEFTKVN